MSPPASRTAARPYAPRRGLFGGRAVSRARVVVVAATGLLAVLLAIGASGLVQVLYLPGTLALGLYLYRYHPPVYVGYTLWVWFITPFVRRLVDYQQGWNPDNPVLVAPLLVTALTTISIARWAPLLRRTTLVPFILVLAALVYGHAVGVVTNGLMPATYTLLTWLVPVTFAFYLAVEVQRHEQMRRAIQDACVHGVAVLGAYGIYQFIAPPPWDRYWMISSGMNVIGLPEPFLVRVFSMLNSPAPFSAFVMVGLLLLLPTRHRLRLPALVIGTVAFLLTLVRSAWLGWALGLLTYVYQARTAARMRLLLAAATLVLAMTPILSYEPIAQAIGGRFETFGELEEDASFLTRLQFHLIMGQELVDVPLGNGLGSTGAAARFTELELAYPFDSGLLDVFYNLGWVGGVLYLIGVGWLMVKWLRSAASDADQLDAAFRGAGVAILATMMAYHSLIGLSGLLFWGPLGLALGGHRARIAATGALR